jgi:hypothetical protein
MARLLGYYVSEGSITRYKDEPVSFELSFGEHELETWVTDACMLLRGMKIGYSRGKVRHGKATIKSHVNREAAAWLYCHGFVESHNKRLSEDVMQWPLTLKAELIKGCVRGDGGQWDYSEVDERDGTVTDRFRASYTTTSLVLARQLQLILAQFGIFARIVTVPATERMFPQGRLHQCREAYILQTYARHSERLAALVWGDYPKGRHHVRDRFRVEDERILIPIKKVEVVKNTTAIRVYNLAVSGDHSYLVEGVSTYNSSPDRQSFPVHRVLANRYWRLFGKLDPVIGNCLELYSDMVWSDFQLTGEGVDGEVKDHFERMCEKVELLALLPYLVREFMTVGEAVVHCLYDSDERMWDYVTLHNPDNIEVIDAPFIRMDPIIELIPDQRLRAILSSGDPMIQKIKAKLPPELLGRLLARQNLPLDNLNCTFLARKLHPYDVRGTSIITRLWRVLMLEDAVFSTSIATARRHSAPLKVAKLGNPQTGWIPGAAHEQRLLELLAQSELDPHAWLVYHFGVSFEAFGTTERAIWVGREWEALERIKLVGLGMSKGMISGEVTYASSVTGLQVFLQRLLSMRGFFERKWIYEKFFRPIAEINEFVKPSQAELNHRIRVRRTAKELAEDNRYIVPKCDWDKKLDPNVDRDLIAAYESLERIGVPISSKTKLSAVNLKYENELKSRLAEQVLEAKERQKYEEELGPAGQGPTGVQPSDMTVEQYEQSQGNPGIPGPGQPGGPPATRPPPRPGMPPAPQQTPQGAPQQASPDGVVRRPMPRQQAPQPPAQPQPPAKSLQDRDPDQPATKRGNWTEDEIEAVTELFRTGRSDEAFWYQAATDRFKAAIARDDYEEAWDDLQLYLEAHGYPDEDLGSLRRILVLDGILQSDPEDHVKDIYDAMPDSVESDSDAEAAFVRAFAKKGSSLAKDAPKSNGNGVEAKKANGYGRWSASSAADLVGAGNAVRGGDGGSTNPFRKKRD